MQTKGRTLDTVCRLGRWAIFHGRCPERVPWGTLCFGGQEGVVARVVVTWVVAPMVKSQEERVKGKERKEQSQFLVVILGHSWPAPQQARTPQQQMGLQEMVPGRVRAIGHYRGAICFRVPLAMAPDRRVFATGSQPSRARPPFPGCGVAQFGIKTIDVTVHVHSMPHVGVHVQRFAVGVQHVVDGRHQQFPRDHQCPSMSARGCRGEVIVPVYIHQPNVVTPIQTKSGDGGVEILNQPFGVVV